MIATLPPRVHLLHIGPHKSGTTTLQAAFHQNRQALAEQGVHYAGAKQHAMAAAMAAALGRTQATWDLSVGLAKWAELVEEVRASSARATVISSEFFSEATPDRIRAIVEDLGAERTHVVITLRPLVRILASQWQQFMQNRPALKYDDDLGFDGWLDAILNHPDSRTVTPSFWARHRHDQLVRNWCEVVGPECLTVVVVDDSDRGMVLRSFERILDLTEGTLQPRDLAANRSLTLHEVEMLRAFNRQYLTRGWSSADYTRFVRFGAVRYLQERRPGAEEPRILTPRWAVDRSARLGAEMAEAIRGTRVSVIGDLGLLGDPAVATSAGDNPVVHTTPSEIVARFAAGLVVHLAATPRRPARGRVVGEIEAAARGVRELIDVELRLTANRSRVVEARRELAAPANARVDDLSTGRLLSVLFGRMRLRVGGLLRRRVAEAD